MRISPRVGRPGALPLLILLSRMVCPFGLWLGGRRRREPGVSPGLPPQRYVGNDRRHQALGQLAWEATASRWHRFRVPRP
jgi:hypothetical protein